MSSNSAFAQMSEAEAKKEHDDIQAEIAKEKGIPDAPAPDAAKPDEPDLSKPDTKKDEELTPEGDLSPEGDKPDGERKPKDGEREEDDVVDPRKPTSRYIPLSKYQDFKKKAQEESTAKDTEIAQLKKDLEASKSNKEIGVVVKTFAEKHNVSEDFAKDMLDMAKAILPKPDPKSEQVLSQAEVFIKKNEAKEAFEREFESLVKDIPEAADQKNLIMQEAYRDGNLDKSLFEIFHRFMKPEVVPKKKTGEATRGPSSTRHATVAFDPKSISERVNKGEKGVLDGLSGEQLDKVFDYMDKSGSRYS